MSKISVDREKRKNIIRLSYAYIKLKEREGKTKEATINSMVAMIKKELKDNAN